MRQPVYFSLSWCLQRGTLNSATPGPLSVQFVLFYPLTVCAPDLQSSSHALYMTLGPITIYDLGLLTLHWILLSLSSGQTINCPPLSAWVTLGPSRVSALIWRSPDLCLLPCSAVHVHRVHLQLTSKPSFEQDPFMLSCKQLKLNFNYTINF